MKTCLKCGFENPAETVDPLAACPKCGAIYSRVEAHAAKTGVDPATATAEAKARAQFNRPVPAVTQPPGLPRKPVTGQPTSRRRWFTPSFALIIFIAYTALMGLIAIGFAITAGGSAVTAGFVIALLLVYGLGAICLELIMVVFHISATLEDCRDYLRAIHERRD